MIPTIPEELMILIKNGEGLTVEFKESTTKITNDVYQTVCSFSNREGGHIFLGVKDNGEICGVDKNCIDKIEKDFVTSINNEKKISPALYLKPERFQYEGHLILYIYVPVGQDVCRCNNRIYDRLNDSDIDITNHSDEVSRLYSKKTNFYYVNKVTKFGVESLRPDLLNRARKMARATREDHSWMDLTDEELLRSVGLILTDEYTKQEGVTIAGILLFGKDSTIMAELPQYKTDAVFRVFNMDRYDDRDVIITNLIESYDRLFEFGKKHLNDTFHLEGIQNISARDHILREIISNLLEHRDFSSNYSAKMVIERGQIYTENANLSHGNGRLNPDTFTAYAKNPPISRVFREIGLADELGSGMRNTYKYTKMYSNSEPQFIEGDVFKTIIPLSEVATATVGPTVLGKTILGSTTVGGGVGDGAGGGVSDGAGGGVGDGVSDGVGDGVSDGVPVIKLDPDRLNNLLDFCTEERTKMELMEFCKIKSDSYFRKNILKPLLAAKLLKRTVPDKPNSPHQKYVRA